MKNFIAVVLVAVAYGSVMNEKLPERERRQECPNFECGLSCPGGFQNQSDGCPICRCICDFPECAHSMNCRFGFVFDQFQCPICQCQQDPACPELVCTEDLTECLYGRAFDENYCWTCNCDEPTIGDPIPS